MIEELYKKNIILEGDFTLKSGIKSKHYIDIKKSFSEPDLFRNITQRLFYEIKDIKELDSYSIVGVPYSGIPFASNISFRFSLPLLLLRKEIKSYGTKKLLEGEKKNKNIILIRE